jgi:hypothetical protein
MTLRTKVLTREFDENENLISETWDDFCFDLTHYIAHARDKNFCELYLMGMSHSVLVQLSFEEIAFELENLNTFERISLN